MNEILVGIDGSEVSLHAVKWAAREAALRKAPLVVANVLQRWLYDMREHAQHAEVGRWAREDAARMLDEAVVVARKAAPDIDVTTRLLAGDARPALLDASASAAMLVVGGRGEGGFVGLLVGSIAHGIASHSHIPVVVVQSPVTDPGSEIVAGVDGSPGSRAAAEQAFAEAELRGLPVRVVYSWKRYDGIVPDVWIYGTAPQLAHEIHIDEDAARRTLADAIADAVAGHPDVKVIEQLEVGHPTDALVHAARNADLLVVGRRGGGDFPHLRIGSVSHGVLHHAPCPAMIVPE
jgi:nucleotide-binding universal stress UspA family protein